MTDVVINTRHGGFGLSDAALERLRDKHGWDVTEWEDGSLAEDAPIVRNDTGRTLSRLRGEYSLMLDVYDDAEWRTNPDLVEVIETLGDDANGKHADLKVVEIPDDVEWTIEEYDGAEWVAEEHRTWP